MVLSRLRHQLVLRARTLLEQTRKTMAESAAGHSPAQSEKRAADSTVDDSEVTAKKSKLEETAGSTQTNSEQRKLPKRKVALLLSYSGKDYNGMQRNKGVDTIEGDLLSALVAVEAVPQNHADVPQKMQFQRCARTDKGVSAVRQIVSLKMALIENAVDEINGHLPPAIRVISCKRVTGGFNAKNACSHRTYSYMLPTFSFAHVEQLTTEKFRISDDVLQQVETLLNSYKGTHNFHNFTSGKAFNEQSAMRFMRELTLSKPFVRNGLEFVVITIVGQSFMIHQIRKMIGLVIAITRGVAPRDTLDRCWGDNKMDIPKAPSLGLMLENVHFDQYNKRYGNDGLHEALLWDDMEDTIGRFKEEHIYPTIIETEIKEKSMMKWLTSLPLHTYDVRNEYRSPLGMAQLNVNKAQQEMESPNDSTTPNDSTAANNSTTNSDQQPPNAGEGDVKTEEETTNQQTEVTSIMAETGEHSTNSEELTSCSAEQGNAETENCQGNDQKSETTNSHSDSEPTDIKS